MSMEIDGPFLNVERGTEKAADFMYVGGKNALTAIGTEEAQAGLDTHHWNHSRNKVTDRPLPSDPSVLATFGLDFNEGVIEDANGIAYTYPTYEGLLAVDPSGPELVFNGDPITGSTGNEFGSTIPGLVLDGTYYSANNYWATQEVMPLVDTSDGSLIEFWTPGSDWVYATAPTPWNGGELIVFATADPNSDDALVGVDPADGSVQWWVTGLGTGGQWPQAYWENGDRFIVPMSDNTLGVIDPNSGTLERKTDSVQDDYTHICVNGDYAYASGNEMDLFKVDLTDGSVVWHNSTPTTQAPGTPAVYDGYVFLSARDWNGGSDAYVCLDDADGSVVWTDTSFDSGSTYGRGGGISRTDNAVITASDNSGWCRAFDLADGTLLWEVQLSYGAQSIPLVTEGGRAVYCTDGMQVVGDA